MSIRLFQAIKGFLGPAAYLINRKGDIKAKTKMHNTNGQQGRGEVSDVNSEERIARFVERHMTSTTAGAHEFEHVKRVYGIATDIGNRMGADLRVLKPAALLHDVGRSREEVSGITHSILSGEIGEEVLREVGYNDEHIQRIKAVIRTHRYSEGLRPTTLEGEILSDADKLDAMGAIGIFRAIAQATVKGVGIEGFLRHSDEKLLRLQGLMYTEEGRNLAKERHEVLSSFIKELRTELAESSRISFEI